MVRRDPAIRKCFENNANRKRDCICAEYCSTLVLVQAGEGQHWSEPHLRMRTASEHANRIRACALRPHLSMLPTPTRLSLRRECVKCFESCEVPQRNPLIKRGAEAGVGALSCQTDELRGKQAAGESHVIVSCQFQLCG